MSKEFYDYKPGDKVRILPSISDYQSIGRMVRPKNDIIIVDYPYMIGSNVNGSSGKSDLISDALKTWKRLMVASNRKNKIKKILS